MPRGLNLLSRILMLLGGALSCGVANGSETNHLPADMVRLIEYYCADCHSGADAEADIDFVQLQRSGPFVAEYRKWETAIRMLQSRQMPPPDSAQPTAKERRSLADGIREAQRLVAGDADGDPGNVIIRRLTDAEHRYSLQDLTGFELSFPQVAADAVGGEGFTNVGFVQFVQDATLEGYLAAAKVAADHAVVGAGPISFFPDRGQTGTELSAINRIQAIYREHGFRTAAGEGGEPFGLDQYPRAFYTAWLFQHRRALGMPQDSLEELASKQAISPNFAGHIWSVLNAAAPSFPTSEVIARWQDLPEPSTADRDTLLAVRAQCDAVYDALRHWQVALTGADDEEVARVLTAETLSARPEHSLKARVVWPQGERTATLSFSAAAVDGKTDAAVVIWRNPRIRFRDLDRRWQEYQPLHDALPSEARKVLGFATGEAAEPTDFAVRAGSTKQFVLSLPEHAWDAQLVADVCLGPTSGRDRVLRSDFSAGLLRDRGKSISVLLADTSSPQFDDWLAGVLAFARSLPQVSHREPAPSDRDPIPALFDNTYNMPERNYFHSRIKYARDDRFLTDSMLDDVTRRRLDAAWADLLTSFDYHDLCLQFAIDKFDLTVELDELRALDGEGLAKLPAVPRRHVGRLIADQKSALDLRKQAESQHLEQLLEFAERAWRRPLAAADERRLRSFYDQARSDLQLDHVRAVRATIARILVAPAFLYRAELPVGGDEGRLSDWELASRLSYFLWSSLPDDELRRAARQGELADPRELQHQARRMLRDPKAQRLAREFFGQWFGFYQFDAYRGVDSQRFPEFTEGLRQSMYDEAIAFFDYIVRQDRPVTEILFADYAFWNDELARHYGRKETDFTSQFRRVAGVRDVHRGGLFGLGAILTVTSAPLRTSAVKRGDWVLRRVMGTPVPPPPADAGSIPAEDVLADGLTVRERLENHRNNPSCMSCHIRIDPLGFALENYDALGRWRETYRGGQPVNAASVLRDGAEISGPGGLQNYLQNNERLFRRNLCRKLLGYALGRRESLTDLSLIDELMAVSEKAGCFSDLVEKIVVSKQFRYHTQGQYE